MIELAVDNSVQAAYLKLTDKKIERTVEMNPGLLIDFDEDGEIVGIEYLAMDVISQASLESAFKHVPNVKVRVEG